MLNNHQKFNNEIKPGGFCEMHFLLKPYIDNHPILKDVDIDFSVSSYNSNHDAIKITMWETTRLKLEEVKLINRCRVVFVPSRTLMYIFSASGVTRPIEVFDGFIDDCYTYKEPIKKDKLIIGMGYSVNHLRKNQYFAIECFLEAFEDVNDVELWIKTDEYLDIKDDKVKIINGILTKQQIVDWYEQIDVFYTTSRGEGIGMFNLQSMACGRPIISNDFLTVADYANEENSFIIPHSLVIPNCKIFGRQGLWADMKKEDVVKILRTVYNNRYLIYEKAKNLPRQVEKYKASISIPKLLNQLEKYVY